MQLLAIRLINFKQFKDVFFDFTDSEGKLLKNICFIGRNGTGKSTLLKLIDSIAKEPVSLSFDTDFSLHDSHNYTVIYSLSLDNNIYHIVKKAKSPHYIISDSIRNINGWQDYLISTEYMQIIKDNPDLIIDTDTFIDKHSRNLQNNFLLIYSPAESYNNEYIKIEDAPETSLDDALALSEDFPFYHIVDNSTVKDFWNVLIYLNRERESRRSEFEIREENLDKTKKELIALFDSANPKILERIASMWNIILEKAGLEFDINNINTPIQKSDNLKAFIKLKNSGKTIKYNELSTGIRNFIFRVGHICSLYFDREISSGFLLVDEPENSLYPDFLLDIADIYSDAVVDTHNKANTQIFMATHSPLVAGQFEPLEKIVLEWNANGYIDIRRGKSPAGDDPNDVLKEDFGLSEVLGKKGLEMWNRFIKLKQMLQYDSNGQSKKDILQEIIKIQELYKF